MPRQKTWRCFHCDELFTNPRHAASHFGVEEGTTPGCVAVLRHGESHLLDRIRDLTQQLSRFYEEDGDIMRWQVTKESDHRRALICEEERGYEKGCRDMRAMLEAEGVASVSATVGSQSHA